ncbi:uncharacterized protein LOC127135908 [Lathyrus oleraceus]|uniref:uncharacterized protein LOC127135908 n=1 Tax=Pisum sativum TaxID=3888 RepID=UPI0021CE8922|nr:uncharacterized protein LOC127135908 [Pisum sativum]
MKAHLQAQGDGIWEAVENGPHNPTSMVNGVAIPKVKSSYDEDDKKRILNENKAINLLQSALIMDDFFRTSQCKSAKEIWDTLVETREGIADVKRSRLNTLSQEYEMFIMHLEERTVALQQRSIHLTNHLIALTKTFANDDLNLKVLRSLTIEWKPKVTAISEKKSLSTITSASLFRKLQEHELELRRLEKHEIQEKKSKGIALKVDSKEDKDDGTPEENKNFMLLIKRLGKKEFKNKKAYGAWKDNEIISSSGSESDECANLAFMASHHSDDEEDEVNNDFSLYGSDAQGAINELLKECKILYKTISSQNKLISSLKEKVVTMEKDIEDEKQKMISEKQNFVCLKTTSNIWYLDSGCSKHMSGDINKFSNLVLKAKGYVTYGYNNKGRILGIEKVESPPFTSIEDVLYVEGLKKDLLSISQLCDKGFKIKFAKDECLIEDEVTHEVKLKYMFLFSFEVLKLGYSIWSFALRVMDSGLANQTRAPPKADSSFRPSTYGVLAAVSSCCPPPKGRFLCVTHPFATGNTTSRPTCMCKACRHRSS